MPRTIARTALISSEPFRPNDRCKAAGGPSAMINSRTYAFVNMGVPRSNHSSKSRVKISSRIVNSSSPTEPREIDERSGIEAGRVRFIPHALDPVVALGAIRVRIGRMIADDQDSAGPEQLELASDERLRIGRVMRHEPRDGCVERT